MSACMAVALLGVPGDSATNLASGPDGVTAGGLDRSEEAVASWVARESGEPVQVEGLTSETTQVWALPDGQFRAEISAGVVRFRRGDGWAPVDLTLRQDADGSVVPVAHPNDLRISGARPAGAYDNNRPSDGLCPIGDPKCAGTFAG